MEYDEYREDDALSRLDKEELSKFAKILNYYVDNQSSSDALVVCLANSVELEDSVEDIKQGYTQDVIDGLVGISKLIDQVIPSIRDKTLKSTLISNRTKISELFDRLGIVDHPNADPNPDDSARYRRVGNPDMYPQYRKYAKRLAEDAKFVPNRDPSEAYGQLSKQLVNEYQKGIRDPLPDIELCLRESLERLHQRREESKRWDIPRSTELSMDPRQRLSKVIDAISQAIISSENSKRGSK